MVAKSGQSRQGRQNPEAALSIQHPVAKNVFRRSRDWSF